jgi:phosphatidate phosphatase APP1
MFRFSLLCVFIFTSSFTALANAEERAYIISGFDDVLRQAENTGLVKASIKIFEKDKTFSGMPELYQVISHNEGKPQFVLVSAISSLFDGRIGKFLTRTHYPANQRYLRNWLTQWSIEEFKIAKINEIIAKHPNKKFIVIFDNSDASITLAEKLHEELPEKIQAVYLRQVVEKNIPASAIGFYTAFDIAVNEQQASRLSSLDVMAVANALLKETNREMLFPSYAVCPTTYDPCLNISEDLAGTCSQVRNHIQSLCR